MVGQQPGSSRHCLNSFCALLWAVPQLQSARLLQQLTREACPSLLMGAANTSKKKKIDPSIDSDHFFALSYNSITFCRWPVETHIKIYSMEVCHLNRRCKSIQSFIMSGGLGRTHSPSSDLSTSKLHERRLGGNKLCTKGCSFLRRLAEQKREESPVQLSKLWRQM